VGYNVLNKTQTATLNWC